MIIKVKFLLRSSHMSIKYMAVIQIFSILNSMENPVRHASRKLPRNKTTKPIPIPDYNALPFML